VGTFLTSFNSLPAALSENVLGHPTLKMFWDIQLSSSQITEGSVVAIAISRTLDTASGAL
jgi:hypothetical protein